MTLRRVEATVRGRPAEHLRREAEGPRLVLLHGAGANADVWEPLARRLDAFDLAIPSLPGRGGSAGPAFERADEAAGWLEEWLAELGGPPPIVLGHSYGGGVAIELALASERVAGLVLVGTGAKLRVHPTILETAEQAARIGEPVPSRFAFSREADPAAIARYERAAGRTPPEAALADWRACDGFDRRADLPRIGAPALVVGGAADALTPPKYHRYLAEHLPRAQLELVPGAGHMLPWEQPEALARRLRTWAAGVG